MIDNLPQHDRRVVEIRALAFGVLVLMLTVLPASARQSEPATEIQSYRWPGWSFTPSLAVGAIYDSNVALSDARADLGETQGDSFFNIVPGGQLEFIGKYTDFGVNYRGFLRRYLEADGLDGFDQRASMNVRRILSRRLTVALRDSFADTPTTDEVELNGVPFRRTGSRTNTLAATADYRFTKFTTLSTRYDQTWVSFDRPDIFLTGGWIHGIRSELSQRLSEVLAVGGEYGYRTASLNEGARQFTFQDAGGVVRLTLGPHTSASAAGGFATLRDRNAAETKSGPYVRLGLTHHIEAATLGASFERQYVPSFGFGGTSNSQEIRGYVLMPLRQGLYTQGSAAWRRMMPFEGESLQLDTIWIRSTIGYAPARWARIEVLYTFTRQDSIVTGGEVDRHRVGLQFVISQPMRIH